MRRLYQAGALATLGVGLGSAPLFVGCWGEEFSAAPPVGGLGGASSASGAAGPSAGAGAASGTGQGTTGSIDGCGTAEVMAGADTYVDGMFADDNYDKKALGDDELEIYQFGVASRRILIYFDVRFWIPDTYQVNAARLELELAEVPDSFGSIDVHKILLPESTAKPAWDERFVTWNRYTADALWTTPGGDFDPTASASAAMEADWPVGTVISWDVTEDVKAFHTGAPNAGWMLKETHDPVDGLGIGYVFFGRESEVVLEEPDDQDSGVPDDPMPAPPPDTTTGTTTTGAMGAGGSTAGAAGSTAGAGGNSAGGSGAGGSGAGGTGADMPDAGSEDEGPGVHPRLLVDVCRL